MVEPPRFFAFTTTHNGLSNTLKNDVTISYNGNSIVVKALWDTGATNSCISTEVASNLSLIPTGKRLTKTAGGTREANTYVVDVGLPNNVNIPQLPVSDSTIGDQGIGMLIGMDIICMGDFSVSNHKGLTAFSFRMPSKQKTDYVEQINLDNLIGQRHGKGKRKHK